MKNDLLGYLLLLAISHRRYRHLSRTFAADDFLPVCIENCWHFLFKAERDRWM